MRPQGKFFPAEEFMAKKKIISQELTQLMDELIKAHPDSHRVKDLMHRCNIPYSKDPLVQMSQVLDSVSNFQVNKATKAKEL